MQDYDPKARDGSLALSGLWRARACAMPGRVARIAALAPIGRFSHPARRCRSSVVEHPLGKGEVVSSILTGSTRDQILSPTLPSRFMTFRDGTIHALVQKRCTLFSMSSRGSDG